ncbi:hypothetical protein [Acinetobacter sp. B51(2017)]|uniref:hypothetical protein n=1 Tax=Acinetobacter sp. B51(2017) TaxID=2060938 RepID=UPI000F0891FA|nr:hypothetical protein [Acinetobacter sp. B51(2017)]
MIKITLSLAVFIACIATYMLYRQEQQHKQHVAAVVSEAQSSLQYVQKTLIIVFSPLTLALWSVKENNPFSAHFYSPLRVDDFGAAYRN